ncbi:unnamed protein product [Owenia fusiformis]|uniref:DRBM domain-containing protein n=2 Tax=Owenia fusiformis TaxID=6347 RepID=A0A8S4PYK9_OWEFU|nr:unnamed protein product [Owenia fusiformis]
MSCAYRPVFPSSKPEAEPSVPGMEYNQPGRRFGIPPRSTGRDDDRLPFPRRGPSFDPYQKEKRGGEDPNQGWLKMIEKFNRGEDPEDTTEEDIEEQIRVFKGSRDFKSKLNEHSLQSGFGVAAYETRPAGRMQNDGFVSCCIVGGRNYQCKMSFRAKKDAEQAAARMALVDWGIISQDAKLPNADRIINKNVDLSISPAETFDPNYPKGRGRNFDNRYNNDNSGNDDPCKTSFSSQENVDDDFEKKDLIRSEIERFRSKHKGEVVSNARLLDKPSFDHEDWPPRGGEQRYPRNEHGYPPHFPRGPPRGGYNGPGPRPCGGVPPLMNPQFNPPPRHRHPIPRMMLNYPEDPQWENEAWEEDMGPRRHRDRSPIARAPPPPPNSLQSILDHTNAKIKVAAVGHGYMWSIFGSMKANNPKTPRDFGIKELAVQMLCPEWGYTIKDILRSRPSLVYIQVEDKDIMGQRPEHGPHPIISLAENLIEMSRGHIKKVIIGKAFARFHTLSSESSAVAYFNDRCAKLNQELKSSIAKRDFLLWWNHKDVGMSDRKNVKDDGFNLSDLGVFRLWKSIRASLMRFKEEFSLMGGKTAVIDYGHTSAGQAELSPTAVLQEAISNATMIKQHMMHQNVMQKTAQVKHEEYMRHWERNRYSDQHQSRRRSHDDKPKDRHTLVVEEEDYEEADADIVEANKRLIEDKANMSMKQFTDVYGRGRAENIKYRHKRYQQEQILRHRYKLYISDKATLGLMEMEEKYGGSKSCNDLEQEYKEMKDAEELEERYKTYLKDKDTLTALEWEEKYGGTGGEEIEEKFKTFKRRQYLIDAQHRCTYDKQNLSKSDFNSKYYKKYLDVLKEAFNRQKEQKTLSKEDQELVAKYKAWEYDKKSMSMVEYEKKYPDDVTDELETEYKVFKEKNQGSLESSEVDEFFYILHKFLYEKAFKSKTKVKLNYTREFLDLLFSVWDKHKNGKSEQVDYEEVIFEEGYTRYMMDKEQLTPSVFMMKYTPKIITDFETRREELAQRKKGDMTASTDNQLLEAEYQTYMADKQQLSMMAFTEKYNPVYIKDLEDRYAALKGTKPDVTTDAMQAHLMQQQQLMMSQYGMMGQGMMPGMMNQFYQPGSMFPAAETATGEEDKADDITEVEMELSDNEGDSSEAKAEEPIVKPHPMGQYPPLKPAEPGPTGLEEKQEPVTQSFSDFLKNG